MQAESPVIQNASAHKSRPVIWSTERLDSAVKSGSCDAGHSPIPSPRDSGGGLGRGADALSRAAAPPLPPRFARLPDARDLSIPPTIQTVRCSGRFSRALDGPPDGFLKVTGRTRFLQKAVTKRPSSLHCLGVASPGQDNPRDVGILFARVAQHLFASPSWHCKIADQNINVRRCVQAHASLFGVKGQHRLPFSTSPAQTATDSKKNRGLVVHHEYPFHGSRNSTVLGTDLSPSMLGNG